MRFFNFAPSTRIPLVWSRITFSKFTTAFFVVVVVHCLIQVSFEVFAYHVNTGALDFLQSVFDLGISPASGFAIFNNLNLTICAGVPTDKTCQVVWQADAEAAKALPSNATSTPYAAAAPITTTPPTIVQASDVGDTNRVVTATASAIETSAKAAATTASVSYPFVNAGFATTRTIDLTPTPSSAAPLNADTTLADLAAQLLHETQKRSVSLGKRGYSLQPQTSSGQFTGVMITDDDLKGGQLLATPDCIMSLQVPIQSLRNTKREDLTFIMFQVWVFGMSLVAILNESIPHVIASLLTHLLATIWSGYQLEMTEQFHAQFVRLIVDGPCQANLLPHYWTARGNAEIAVAALNAAVLIVTSFLSYKLIKSFGWQTFKRIGASFSINRIYRLVLALSISIQLSVFFIGANVVLWIDQLYHGNVAIFGPSRDLFKGVYIVVLILLFPWLALGWFAVRRERKLMMLSFLVLALVMITGWAMMFVSTSFLWTFKSWDFFATITVAAAVLLFATLALGITCRLNFGKGLPRYLNAQQPITGDDFVPADLKEPYDDEEKVGFPSSSPIPTFSVAFGSGTEVPPPSQMQFASTRPAPGISMHARGTSEADIDVGVLRDRPDFVSRPAPAITRSGSTSSSVSAASSVGSPTDSASDKTERADSVESRGSSSTSNSTTGLGVRGHRHTPSDSSNAGGRGGRRWIIE